MTDSGMSPARAVEAAARRSYARLVALLAARAGDIALAEDVLSSALVSALATWPVMGVPASPEAWLITVARRSLVDVQRRHSAEQRALAAIAHQMDRFKPDSADPGDKADAPRLRLLFVCAHPALDASHHAPLMLQGVLGLDVACIARACAISDAAMEKRLTRAKAKVRDARISFEFPPREEWGRRLSSVLDGVYAAFGLAWESPGAGQSAAPDIDTREAIELARLIVEMLPAEPEARGLLSCMLFCESRRQARAGPGGRLVPLGEQQPSHWDQSLIAQAEEQLRVAAASRRPGRYQLEAAIQSAHAARSRGDGVPWQAIVALYRSLIQVAPSLGARVALAAALHNAGQTLAAHEELESISPEEVRSFQSYWAVLAHVLKGLGRDMEGGAALARAIELAPTPQVARFLHEQFEKA